MVDWRVIAVYLYSIAAGIVTGIILGITVARTFG